MARLNLTIPDPLYDRLERWRDRVNISRVCAIALEEELAMLEGTLTATPDPRVERLVRRLEQQQEQKDRWYRRGYQDGEKWAIDFAGPDELRRMAEEQEFDYNDEDILDEVDEDEFPSVRLWSSINEWLKSDLAEAGEEANRESLKRASQQLERGAYVRGWHEAARELWQVAAPALRRFRES